MTSRRAPSGRRTASSSATSSRAWARLVWTACGSPQIDTYYRRLLDGSANQGRPLSPATIRRLHGVLRRALGQAARWGWIAHNYAADASPPRVHAPEVRPPTPAEVGRLFRLASGEDPTLAAFVILAATGARRSELVALRWSDIDIRRASMTIRHGVVLGPDGLVEKGTKTHAVRNVSLDPTTLAALLAHQARADELALAFGTTRSPGSYVFSLEPDGSSTVRPDSMSRAFRQLCAKAGVPGARLHDPRHYVATQLLAGGVDVRTVAGRLGHRNPSTTLNVYSHFLPEADRSAATLLAISSTSTACRTIRPRVPCLCHQGEAAVSDQMRTFG